MIYYQVGVADYNPRILRGFRDGIADYSDYYEIGEAIPIILYFAKNPFGDHKRIENIVYITNTVPNLKPGDSVCVNVHHNEMYKIITDSRGVRVNES